MRREILALLAASALSVPAIAADLPARTVAPVVPVASVAQMSFSGVYLGLSAGWGQGTYNDNAGGKITANGALVGITAGYNHQYRNNVVVGVEADISWAGIKKSRTTTDSFSTMTWVSSATGEQNLFATFRPRIGYAFGNWMPYLTGGLAVTDSKLKFKEDTYNLGVLVGTQIGSASKTRVGWTIGGGVEVLLTANISAKLEYLYADFGKARYDFGNGNVTNKVSLRDHIIRAGMNYHF